MPQLGSFPAKRVAGVNTALRDLYLPIGRAAGGQMRKGRA